MTELILGLDTFGDVAEDDSGALVSYAEAIRQVVAEATLADELGVDADQVRAMLDRFPDSPRGRIVAQARSRESDEAA
jgi:hypothetical protein